MMNWRIGPWREVYLLKCKVKGLEEAYQRMKNNELLYRNRWLTTYRSLIAQQKGCVRLRRRLNKLLGKPATREGTEG